MKRSSSEAKMLILEGTAPEGLQVSGDLWLDGCTGLTAGGGLQNLQGKIGYLYYTSPAPWLTTAVLDVKCGGFRPVERDRGYWSEVLRIDLLGCYEVISRRISRIKNKLLERPDLEEWQRVAIRMFR